MRFKILIFLLALLFITQTAFAEGDHDDWPPTNVTEPGIINIERLSGS